MGCNCGKNKQRVRYQVTNKTTNQTSTYDTVAEAQANCKGCPIKAVPA